MAHNLLSPERANVLCCTSTNVTCVRTCLLSFRIVFIRRETRTEQKGRFSVDIAGVGYQVYKVTGGAPAGYASVHTLERTSLVI